MLPLVLAWLYRWIWFPSGSILVSKTDIGPVEPAVLARRDSHPGDEPLHDKKTSFPALNAHTSCGSDAS
jgi:hypothetical protein